MTLYKTICIILLTTLIPVAATTAIAQTADNETYWLLVDTTPDAQAHNLMNKLNSVIAKTGKVPKKHIRHLENEQATKQEIQATLNEIGNISNSINTLIFLFHGEVSMSDTGKAMHLKTQSEDTIEDTILNKGFKAAGIDRTIVILDGYAQEQNLGIYYANRETLGNAALNLIQPFDTAEPIGKNSFIQTLTETLSEETTDIDDNRNISVKEIDQQIQNKITFENSILVPTGNVNETILKLSPAIKVTSIPEGAKILLNDVESGLTPKRFTENLQSGTMEVRIKKNGFMSPAAKTAELKRTQGEFVNLSWKLTPISVIGTVAAPEDISTTGASVSINGTDYVQIVADDGTYAFQNWNPNAMLIPGNEYTLNAIQGDLYHGAATFTYEGYTPIQQNIELVKMTWFEITELEFKRNDHQKAIEAFKNGIQNTTDLPQLSPDLTVMLYSHFAAAVDRSEIKDINAIVATAKLAEAYQQPQLAKKYWKLVKATAEKGTDANKLARKHLWQLNKTRNIINICLICLLIILAASGSYTYYRYRKSKQIETTE